MTTEQFRELAGRDLNAARLLYFEYRADEWLNDGPTEAARVLSLWRYAPLHVPRLAGDNDPARLANLSADDMAAALLALVEAGDLDMGWESTEDLIADFEERYAKDDPELADISAGTAESLVPAPRAVIVPAGVAAAADAVRAYVFAHLKGDEDAASERLDDLVHDCKSAEASTINNGGLDDQVAYLIGAGTTVAEIAQYLEESDEEDDDAT